MSIEYRGCLMKEYIKAPILQSLEGTDPTIFPPIQFFSLSSQMGGGQHFLAKDQTQFYVVTLYVVTCTQ